MDRLQPVFDWVAANPGWAIALAAITCFIDTLFVVGFLMPSYILLLGFGALVALDLLPLWPLVAAAAAGALAGDLLNYWLGRNYLPGWMRRPGMARYHDTIHQTWGFFRRRGGMALIVSRLVGPARPIGPMIAGAAPMGLPRFCLWAVPSCLLWALLYILPGVALGASLQMAAEVATRLAVLLLGAIVLVLGMVWVASLIVRGSTLYAERRLHRLLTWSSRHRRLGWLPRQLADPRYPETPALLLIALLLLAAGWVALVLSWGPARDTPMPVDALVYRAMAELHTPWGVWLARWLAHLSELPVMLVLALAAVITLLALRRGRAAAHAIAALAFGGIIAVGLSLGLRAPDPVVFYGLATDHGHSRADLIFATVVLFLLPVLLARPGGARNLMWYRLPAALLALVAGAHIYLGTQWFSVAIGSVVLGLLWMLALGIGYRRHRVQPVPPRRFLPPMVLSFAAAAISLAPTLHTAAPAPVPQPLDFAAWWEEDWRRLPLQRGDATGRSRQPLPLQWAASATERDALLADAGWQPAVTLHWDTALRYLAASAPVEALPVPPQYLRAQPTQAMFYRPLDDEKLELLRLWHSGYTVDGAPVWLGSLTHLYVRRLLGIARLPYTLPADIAASAVLPSDSGTTMRSHRHPLTGGTLLLLHNPAIDD